MKLLKTGELYSLDRRAAPETQYERAVKLFEMKHKHKPVSAQWNPGTLFKKEGLPGIAVDPHLPPGHLWLDL